MQYSFLSFLFLLTACDSVIGSKESSSELLDNASPEASITSPADGAQVEEGSVVAFQGLVSDPDHAMQQLRVTWSGSTKVYCADLVPADDGTTSCQTMLAGDEVMISLEVVDPDTGERLGVVVDPGTRS